MSEMDLQTGVLIVGAGPAGLGVAAALKRAGVHDILVIDAREIGASFRQWPRQMSLLTPSFHSNSFGLTDLNAIDPETSPADFLRTQHPEGRHYADYLQAVAAHHQLPVRNGIRLRALTKEGDMFVASTQSGEIRADYVVWSTGQFFSPREDEFPGAYHAIHSSKVADWSSLTGEDFTVVGGYESGVDAALNLVEAGKSVRLLPRGESWSSDHPDPSRSLSPRTLDRLRGLLRTKGQSSRLELVKNTDIRHIEEGEGWWILRDQDDIPHVARTRPILANGYHTGLGPVDHLFTHDDNGLPVFSEQPDESTLTPGFFIPVIGWGIASLLFPRESPLFAGLLLYFLFPCTDWFLGFTRLAEGDVALGAVILPVNLISQLLLFPAYLGLICTVHAGPAAGGIQAGLIEWFLFPLGVAAVLRFIHSFLLSARFPGGMRFSPGNIIPWVIGGVVVCLFADNIVILSANPFAFLKILLAVSLFFAASYLAGGLLARHFRLSRPQHVLLLMTTAARNAPLILGLTMVAVPDQPLIHAALIIGLLVEFPHLILLTRLLLRKVSNSSSAPPGSVTEMA